MSSAWRVEHNGDTTRPRRLPTVYRTKRAKYLVTMSIKTSPDGDDHTIIH
ncbi:hypothetical protein RR48_05431 [Papilio machaon]|uniref:Uncharacterized protein n=1 Tax=Papilio machaon TaxID=76193 RepID=A0A0N1PHR9_PAPMA|nr:hypothetical protein RR48_05431 [Papilio machaon]